MAELMVDYLSMVPHDESFKSNHPKRRPVASINEWTQCFTQYIAILSKAKPERTSDLLGYQHLTFEAHLEYLGDGWLVYNCRFHQIAATRPTTQWAQRDGDLWFMAFGNAGLTVCTALDPHINQSSAQRLHQGKNHHTDH